MLVNTEEMERQILPIYAGGNEIIAEWKLKGHIYGKFNASILNMSVLCLQLVPADPKWSKHYLCSGHRSEQVWLYNSLSHVLYVSLHDPGQMSQLTEWKVSGEETPLKGEKNNLWKAISHEINTTIKNHDIIIFAKLLFAYKNVSSSGMDHWQNSWLTEGWWCMSWRYKNLILVE